MIADMKYRDRKYVTRYATKISWYRKPPAPGAGATLSAMKVRITMNHTKPVKTSARNGRTRRCGSCTRTRRLVPVRWSPRDSCARRPVLGFASWRFLCAHSVECIPRRARNPPIIRFLSRLGPTFPVEVLVETRLLPDVRSRDELHDLGRLHVPDLRHPLQVLLGGVEHLAGGPESIEEVPGEGVADARKALDQEALALVQGHRLRLLPPGVFPRAFLLSFSRGAEGG